MKKARLYTCECCGFRIINMKGGPSGEGKIPHGCFAPNAKVEQLSLERCPQCEVVLKLTHQRTEPSDWVGGFECVALDSSMLGERMLFVFGQSDFELVKLGQTRAPDTKSYGPGWKFVLQAQFVGPDAAERAAGWLFHRDEPGPNPRPGKERSGASWERPH